MNVEVFADKDALADAVADRLVAHLAEVQGDEGSVSVVLTGGGIGIAALAAVRDRADGVDWSRVDVWWGDERFVAADSDDRNEKQAREALLDHVPLDPSRVHPMPALSDDVDAAAASYGVPPSFDVLMLGVGPEGHVASIFPHSPAAVDERPVFAVRDCPKPPPTRISLGFSAIQSAREVWVIAAGEEKAAALAAAAGGASQVDVPVAGAVGREVTAWFLDESAASLLS